MREDMLADLLERSRLRWKLREVQCVLRAAAAELHQRGMPDEATILGRAVGLIADTLPKIGGGVEDAGQVLDELRRLATTREAASLCGMCGRAPCECGV